MYIMTLFWEQISMSVNLSPSLTRPSLPEVIHPHLLGVTTYHLGGGGVLLNPKAYLYLLSARRHPDRLLQPLIYRN